MEGEAPPRRVLRAISASALVADLDVQQVLQFEIESEDEPEELTRLQRVFTSPIDRLLDAWGETAKSLKSQKHGNRGQELEE